jgi:hypothetical protein
MVRLNNVDKIRDREYEILVQALDYAHDNTEDNSF